MMPMKIRLLWRRIKLSRVYLRIFPHSPLWHSSATARGMEFYQRLSLIQPPGITAHDMQVFAALILANAAVQASDYTTQQNSVMDNIGRMARKVISEKVLRR